MNKPMSIVLGFTVLLCSLTTFAAEITRDQAAGLMTECQRQRQEQIAPLKKQAIDDCINVQSRGEDYCNRFYRTYGEGGTNSAGGRRPGMFWDLPVCEQALAADRYFKKYPSKSVYSH